MDRLFGKRGKVESIDTEKEIAKVLVDFFRKFNTS